MKVRAKLPSEVVIFSILSSESPIDLLTNLKYFLYEKYIK